MTIDDILKKLDKRIEYLENLDKNREHDWEEYHFKEIDELKELRYWINGQLEGVDTYY